MAKSFKGVDPVSMFTSASKPAPQEENLTPALKPDAPEISIARIKRTERGETKSRRLAVLLTPSLHEKLAEASRQTGVSKNDIINQCLESFLSE